MPRIREKSTQARVVIEVERMVVAPEYHRQGIASALLGRLEALVRDRGCNQIILLTESVRTDAMALCQANGFEARWSSFK